MGRMASISGLSSAMRDHKLSSRRDKLLGLVSMSGAHLSSSTEGNSSSELKDEDLWIDDEEVWSMRDQIEGFDSKSSSMSNCMRWLGVEKDQCADAAYSRGISALSNLNLGLGNASGRDASSARITTPSRLIPQFGMDTGSGALHQSAPMNVPNWSEILGSEEKSFRGLQNMVTAQDEDDDDERLPPHELLAREYAKSQAPTFSVYEGLGRTLKGRDLDRVRNAVLRKTGFIDV